MVHDAEVPFESGKSGSSLRNRALAGDPVSSAFPTPRRHA